ncbi:hypothetical protein QJT90_24525, partial [Bordetella bronchiseptica]
MSVGPPALGSILVQRLDAVLGTTMSAQSNLVSGARPDAVAQPGEALAGVHHRIRTQPDQDAFARHRR